MLPLSTLPAAATAPAIPLLLLLYWYQQRINNFETIRNSELLGVRNTFTLQNLPFLGHRKGNSKVGFWWSGLFGRLPFSLRSRPRVAAAAQGALDIIRAGKTKAYTVY